MTLPFVCEAKFSNSAGYSFMVFDDEAGMSYALIECVAVDQSNYIRKQKPRAFGSPNAFGSPPRGGGGSSRGGGGYPSGGGNSKRSRQSPPWSRSQRPVTDHLQQHNRNYTINQTMTPTVYAPTAGMPQQQTQSQQQEEDNEMDRDDGNWPQVPETPYPPGYAHANSDNSTSFTGGHNRKPPPRG
jgi:hypothetical protein